MNIEILEEDMASVKKIAEKYKISVKELGKVLSNQKTNYTSKQIRFSEEEIVQIDKKIENLDINRSEYIMRCVNKALKEKYYMKMNIKELKIGTYKVDNIRNVRINIYFKNPQLCEDLEIIAKKFSLHVSTLIRTFALNVEL